VQAHPCRYGRIVTFVRRVSEWFRTRPMVADGLLAAVMLLMVSVSLLGDPEPGERPADVGAWLLVLLSFVPIAWRRVVPTVVITLSGIAAITYETLDYPDNSVNAFAVLLALYAVAAYSPRKDSLWAAGFTAVALVAVIAGNWEPEATVGDVIGNYFIFGTAWVAGDAVRQRRERLVALEERALLAEQRAEEDAARAVSEERTRIARELHDVVAHSVSVMVVQAGAARRMLQRDVPDPDRAVEALTSVENVGRESLNELRRLLGVLRKDDERSFGRTPQPSVRHVDDLVQHARDAGLEVELVVEGQERELPAGVDLTAYRIVQEALTNTIKHGGPSVRAEVHVCYGEREVEVVVTDDGRGADAEREGGGHGLVGMNERVSLFGGRLVTGNRPGGGFQVRATLPLERKVDA
jgi:signal transduction histidine kinase